jgi:hypothetical protein
MRSLSIFFVLLLSATGYASDVNISGDVRVRHEVIDDSTAGSHTTRQRLRARVNATAQVSDSTSVGIGLASGGANARSTNQTAGGTFTSKGVMLDTAYIKTKAKGLDFTMGKFKNPLTTLSELNWDNDIRPEGVAIETGYKKFSLKTAYFILDDTAVNDPSLVVGQLGYQGKKFVLTGSYTATQKMATDEAYANVNCAFNVWKLRAFGEYNVNLETSTDDTAWIAGVGADLGKLKVKYTYREVEANGVNSLLTDSDFGNGVDTKGSEVNVSYKYDVVKLGVTYFALQNGVKNGTHYDRLMVDASVAF